MSELINEMDNVLKMDEMKIDDVKEVQDEVVDEDEEDNEEDGDEGGGDKKKKKKKKKKPKKKKGAGSTKPNVGEPCQPQVHQLLTGLQDTFQHVQLL